MLPKRSSVDQTCTTNLLSRRAVLLLPAIELAGGMDGVIARTADGSGEAAGKPTKRVIGATATLTETNSGLTFTARVDTGAETCSLHVEKIEIQDKTPKRVQNI